MALLCSLFLIFIPFASVAQLETKGLSIRRADGCFMVTPSQNNVFGAVWSPNRIDLSQPQSFEFEIYLGNKDGDGGEGLAFLFHADPRGVNATGSSGESLGFGIGPGGDRSKMITPSVAIELDTRNNAAGDIDADHTTVVYNGEINSPQFAPVPILEGGGNLESNQCHTYSFEWNPSTQELRLLVDGNVRVLHRDNIINKVFNGNTSVYYGFTGSTGDGRNEQSVSIIDPDSYPIAVDDKAQTYPGRSVNIPVLNNDSHSKGVSVSVSRIISVEGGGYASVGSNGNEVVYTPSAQTEGVFKVVYEIVEDIPLSCCPKRTTAVIEVQVSCEFYDETFTISPAGPIVVCQGRAVNLGIPFHRTDAKVVWRRNGEVIEGDRATLSVTVSGEYSVEVTTLCGTQTSENTVSVVINPAPPTPEIEDVLQCGFGTVTLTATGGNDGEYRWYTQPENAPPLPDERNGTFVTPELDSDTTYYVSIVQNGCESERVPVNITMREAPFIPELTKIVIEAGESVQLESAEGPYTYKWSPAAGLSSTDIASPVATPSETTTYTVEVTSPSGCVTVANVRVIIREEIQIPNAFSPNGDGVNDTWRIATLEGYPGALLEVFDRWGTKVYEKVDYYDEWNGTYNGKPLPRGAYLYVITLADGTRLTGTVNIVY